jgi:hypothetical protein
VGVAVPIIVLTNGRRECVSRTIPSALDHLTGAGPLTIIDDSGDPEYAAWLRDTFGVCTPTGGVGYWRAMQAVWERARILLGGDSTDSIFLLEDDFVFHADVDLTDLNHVLGTQPHLTQIALLRQAWFANEIRHGGLIEALEAQGQTFEERTDGARHWIEHRACFTGNPSLITARTFARDWSAGAWSESRFGQMLFTDPAARGAYWGRRGDPPTVEHIGDRRTGRDY